MIMLFSSLAFFILHCLQNRDVPFARIPGKNDFLIRAGHIAGNIREGDKQYGERVAEANEARGLVGDDHVELGATIRAFYVVVSGPIKLYRSSSFGISQTCRKNQPPIISRISNISLMYFSFCR
jgi:hypothetical protein